MIRLIFLAFCCLSFVSYFPERGQVIDQYNGVHVYYNGKDFTNVSGRNVTVDGYNLGLKYQCIEFVKRFYLQIFNHYMPYSYGHAKDFFNKKLADVAFNDKRGLMQYRNVRFEKPKVNDILVYDETYGNPFGHVAIISKVTDNEIEIIQQNIGTTTRKNIKLVNYRGIYTIADHEVLGWLRLP